MKNNKWQAVELSAYMYIHNFMQIHFETKTLTNTQKKNEAEGGEKEGKKKRKKKKKKLNREIRKVGKKK